MTLVHLETEASSKASQTYKMLRHIQKALAYRKYPNLVHTLIWCTLKLK